MIVYATKLMHLPVIDAESHQRLGVVNQCIFDPDLGKLSSFEIIGAGLFMRKLYVSFLDIVSIEHHAVLTHADDCLPIIELPKVASIITSRRPILNQTARLATAKLGVVSEVVIEITTGRITQIHTHSLFRDHIFSFKDVEKVTPQAVIIRTDKETVDTEVIPETAPEIA